MGFKLRTVIDQIYAEASVSPQDIATYSTATTAAAAHRHRATRIAASAATAATAAVAAADAADAADAAAAAGGESDDAHAFACMAERVVDGIVSVTAAAAAATAAAAAAATTATVMFFDATPLMYKIMGALELNGAPTPDKITPRRICARMLSRIHAQLQQLLADATVTDIVLVFDASHLVCREKDDERNRRNAHLVALANNASAGAGAGDADADLDVPPAAAAAAAAATMSREEVEAMQLDTAVVNSIALVRNYHFVRRVVTLLVEFMRAMCFGPPASLASGFTDISLHQLFNYRVTVRDAYGAVYVFEPQMRGSGTLCNSNDVVWLCHTALGDDSPTACEARLAGQPRGIETDGIKRVHVGRRDATAAPHVRVIPDACPIGEAELAIAEMRISPAFRDCHAFVVSDDGDVVAIMMWAVFWMAVMRDEHGVSDDVRAHASNMFRHTFNGSSTSASASASAAYYDTQHWTSAFPETFTLDTLPMTHIVNNVKQRVLSTHRFIECFVPARRSTSSVLGARTADSRDDDAAAAAAAAAASTQCRRRYSSRGLFLWHFFLTLGGTDYVDRYGRGWNLENSGAFLKNELCAMDCADDAAVDRLFGTVFNVPYCYTIHPEARDTCVHLFNTALTVERVMCSGGGGGGGGELRTVFGAAPQTVTFYVTRRIARIVQRGDPKRERFAKLAVKDTNAALPHVIADPSTCTAATAAATVAAAAATLSPAVGFVRYMPYMVSIAIQMGIYRGSVYY